MNNLIKIVILNLISVSLSGQIISDFNLPKTISSTVQDTILIDPISCIPLYIEGVKKIYGRDEIVESATGFILEDNSKFYLITNWHVIANRNPTDSTANKIKVKNAVGNELEIDVSDPEKLLIYFHGKTLGEWIPITIDLYDKGRKKWLEHPFGKKVDVVALPINLTDEQKNKINLYSLKFDEYNDEIVKYPSINLSIIGFPFGFSSYGRFPIWKTGQLSSDFDLNFDDLPIFLIDASTRSGMSGSPVILRQVGAIYTKQVVGMGGYVQEFLGIYSGRIGNDSDIGIVWKIECLKEIIK
ncbi:MAG TPA: trypsin-like peptidase domain-containing protein [Saprospiraceae bacterium]|nr:trypsin-like peptidase domain-containing protein [Saprospiraceae bacterium]